MPEVEIEETEVNKPNGNPLDDIFASPGSSGSIDHFMGGIQEVCPKGEKWDKDTQTCISDTDQIATTEVEETPIIEEVETDADVLLDDIFKNLYNKKEDKNKTNLKTFTPRKMINGKLVSDIKQAIGSNIPIPEEPPVFSPQWFENIPSLEEVKNEIKEVINIYKGEDDYTKIKTNLINDLGEAITGTTYENLPSGNKLELQEMAVKKLEKEYGVLSSEDMEVGSGITPEQINAKASEIYVSMQEDYELKEVDTLIEKVPYLGKNPASNYLGDMYRSFNIGWSGSNALDESFQLWSGNPNDEDIVAWIMAVNEQQTVKQTDEMRDFYRIYEEGGKTTWAFIKAMSSSPYSIIQNTLASSMGTMIGSLQADEVKAATTSGVIAGVATATVAGQLGPQVGLPEELITIPTAAIAGGFGAGVAMMEAGLTFSELLMEETGNDLTLENVRAVFEDPEKIENIKRKARNRGIAIGLIEMMTAGLAKGVGSRIITRGGRKTTSALVSGTIEVVGGSTGEVAGRLAAGQGMDVAEIYLEGIGGLKSGPLTIGSNLLQARNITNELKIRNTLRGSEFNNIIEAFKINTPIVEAKIKITQNPEAINILDRNLKVAVTKGEITQKESNDIRENFRKTTHAVNQTTAAGIVDIKDQSKAITLLKRKNILQDQVEAVNDAGLNVFRVNEIKKIDEELTSIIASEIERKETVGMGVVPTKRAQEVEISAQEQADLNQINIDTYKDPNTSETDRNNAAKLIIEDNAGFFLSPKDKGGIDFVTNFEGYRNKDTGKFITRQEVLNEVSALLPGIIGAFNTKGKANFTTYAGASLNAKLPGIKESLIGAKEASKTKEMTAEELAMIPEPKTETQETQGKEFEKRKYPTDVAAIEKQTANVRPEILTNIKNSVKQFIASSVGKVKEIGGKGKTVITKLDPSLLAKELKAQNRATETAVRNAMGKSVKAQNDFIKKVINDGYIETIPIAAMKKRFKTVKGFNIEKIGRETLGPGTGIYKLSGLQEQALIDFYTKDQSGRRSFIDLLSKGLTIEQFQEVKIDTEFMNDLAFKLKEANSELTAEEFMNEVERDYDGRSKEFTSLDRFIENVLDPVIDQYKGTFSSLNPAAFAQALKTGLRAYQKGIKNGLSFAESLQKLINSFSASFKLNLQQKADFAKGVFEKIKTENQLMGKTLIEIMQTSGINVIAKYIEGDVTVNNKNRPARQESVLQSVIKGKIPGQLLELLGLANFGRKMVYGNAKTKFDTLKKAEAADIKNPKQYAVTTNGQYFGTKTKGGQLDARGDWQARKGDLYYGKSDPAYITLMKAANKYNKKKFDKVQRVTIPFVKDKNGKKIFKKLTKADKKANKAQEKINMQALEDFYTILAKRDKNGKLIIPLNDSALLISQSYQGTTALIKIAAPFAGVSQRFIGGQIEEHSPPASSIGAAMIWGIANNQSELIMQGIKDNYIQVQLSISTNNKLNAAKLAETTPEGMSIITPNVGILRLAAAGANLNTITDLETGKSFADKAELPLPKEFKSNPSAVNYQNKLLVDVALIPELTLEKAKENLKASLPTQENKNTQVKNNTKNLAPEFLSEDQTTDQQKEVLENSQNTQVDAQKVEKKRKGISVFDFDDTLAKTKEKVIVYAPYYGPGKMTETRMELTPAEFAERAQELENAGASFDFSQFEDVKGAKKGPLANLALKRQGKFGGGDIFILTARPQTSAQGIKTFLDGIGLNIPIENITGLENGTPQAKARWVLSKTEEGYNDFYFADDAIQNVTAVKQILDQVDVKSKVQQAITDKTINLDKEFNTQIEEATGKEAYKEYSPARARLEGKAKDKGFFKWIGKQLTITPSAEDFMGLMYDIIGKGKQGNRHAQFISDNLMQPFNKAEQAILSAKVTVANDFAALKKAFPSLRTKNGKNPLMQQIGVGPYTKSNAMRVYIWDKQGMEIPGLSKRDQNALVKAVKTDSELNVFADEVILIQKESTYPPPGNNWTGGDISTDILQGLDKGFRNKLMTEFNENAAIIFSEKNMNKLEAIYGTKWTDALKDSLRRMKVGSNRPVYQGGGSRIVNELLDWLNGSVGAIMFLNMRSGLLQTISNINFINWGDNNIYAASKAFASKEYWPTVMKLMNSDYLVNRRDGLKINVNEAELADAAKKSGMKGAIAYMLDKGFIITRIMDSLAIATGGATFYMNRRDALLKRQNPDTGKTYTKKEAETKAFDDFYAISEESQQSSNPSKISQQQASLAGRVILSFQNVTMQYNRKVKKSIRNLYNRRKNPGQTQRESDLGNLSQVIYYTTIQNIIFHSLQQTLFALAFDDETEDEEKDRAASIANGMMDSLLFGLGFGGAAISTVKNVLMKIGDQGAKKNPKYEEAVWSLFDFSPVLDSKVRKIKTGLKTFSWNMEEIKKRGWSLDNPAYLAIAQMVSATTNIPIDRVLRKTMNLRAAMDEETRTWQRVALILGWDTWSLGLPYWGLQSTIKKEEKEKAKIKADYKSDIRKIKGMGYKKVMARVLKDYDPKDIIEMQSPAGTVVYYAKTKK